MIVSWKWLKDYVDLPDSPQDVAERLALAGLNLESLAEAGGDVAIDLEVTSNRPDCLGHIGVAREIAVLYDRELRVPDPQPPAAGPPIEDLTRVRIDDAEHCFRYTARVLQGVRIGPSPDWLAERLETLGIAQINNVVDISNYVMMECGQPLHTFDFDRLTGKEIIVRKARTKESFTAIDHRTYELSEAMCVIADAEHPVAIGGVMGGESTEISESTRSILVEAAEFSPLSIRSTARQLNLHSPSSYRFERGVDPEAIDWASRRCCELILELAGGELAKGVIDVGRDQPTRSPVTLRLSQVARVLGIEIDTDEIVRILASLGGSQVGRDDTSVTWTAPSWRRDWEREIDLIEEVARIHGYDEIPENVPVPMVGSHRRDEDRVLDIVRQVLTAHGFHEAMTASVVPAEWASAFAGWTQREPLQTQSPMLRGADRLRESLLPSLLDCRRFNESLGNFEAELFETAAIYLPSDEPQPHEQPTLALVTPHSFAKAKGVVESIIDALHIDAISEWEDVRLPLMEHGSSVRWMLGGKLLGFVGEIDEAARKQFGLRDRVAVAEIDRSVLLALATIVPQYRPASPYPAIRRDLNLVVDENLRWSALEKTVRTAAGEWLEQLQFGEVYRDRKKDGSNKKRMLFTMVFRSSERTLTGEEVDQLRDRIVEACERDHGAKLLAG